MVIHSDVGKTMPCLPAIFLGMVSLYTTCKNGGENGIGLHALKRVSEHVETREVS